MMRNREINQLNMDDVSVMNALTNNPTTIALIPMLVSIVLVILESPLLKIPFSMLKIPIINTAIPGYVAQNGDTLAILRKRYTEKLRRIPPMINFMIIVRLDFRISIVISYTQS